MLTMPASRNMSGPLFGISIESGASASEQVKIAHTPLIPRKTRHIIKFHRWGIA
jgi:hypothetical protein